MCRARNQTWLENLQTEFLKGSRFRSVGKSSMNEGFFSKQCLMTPEKVIPNYVQRRRRHLLGWKEKGVLLEVTYVPDSCINH